MPRRKTKPLATPLPLERNQCSAWWHVGDFGFVIAVVAYILIGTPFVPFHPDEAMQIYASGDYDIATGSGGPKALATRPPYPLDSDGHLRILNGTVHRHFVGFLRQLAGIGPEHLPPRPGWNWALDLRGNAAGGYLPSGELLMLGRLASSLSLALCVFPTFVIGWLVGRRPAAWLFTALFLLNPAVLINGRRAMQEGSMLLFGMIVILLAFLMARLILANKNPAFGWWVALALGGGMAVASKHIGLAFLAGGGAIILSATAHQHTRRNLLANLTGLVVALAVAGAVFLILSPALWDHPSARLGDLIATRAELIRLLDDGRHGGALRCAERILTMPFVFSPQFFEVADWASNPGVFDGIAHYAASRLGGLPLGSLLGWAITGFAAFGAYRIAVQRDFQKPDRSVHHLILVWWATTALLLIANPLPWQRYYLPLIPPTALLAVVGVLLSWNWLRKLSFWPKRIQKS